MTSDLAKAPHLTNSYVLGQGGGIYDYLIQRADGSIVVGGAKATMAKDKSVWYNNIDDSELIEPAKDYFDGYMQKYFLGWESSGVYIDRRWTGGKLVPKHNPLENEGHLTDAELTH